MTLWQGLSRALELLVTFDSEVMGIASRSIAVSITSTLIAAAICIPVACVIRLGRVPWKRWLVALIQTFYSVPTVLVGLLVFLLFSRAGPLGGLRLMFTPGLMVIGTVVLVSPILLGLVVSAVAGTDRNVMHDAETARGDFELSIALGIKLLLIASILNVMMNRFQQVSIDTAS